MNNLPPGVTDAMIEDQVPGQEWEELFEWLLDSGRHPHEIRGMVTHYPAVRRIAEEAWLEWDYAHFDRDSIPADSWMARAADFFEEG